EARDRGEPGPAGAAGLEVVAGVMPRAVDRAVEHVAFGERTAVVRTGRAERVNLGAVAHEHDRVAADMPEQRHTFAHVGIGDSDREIRTAWRRFTCHPATLHAIAVKDRLPALDVDFELGPRAAER